MQNGEDRPMDDRTSELAPVGSGRPGAAFRTPRFTGNARSAPKGPESRIGDDETHRRLLEARRRARHSTEDMIRRELGPEWVSAEEPAREH
jgi:hypothetical protein